MRAYRWAWCGLTGLFTALGVLVALRSVPWLFLALMVVYLLTIGGQVNALRAQLRPSSVPARPGHRAAFAAVLTVGAAAAVGGTALLGLTVLLGPAAVALVLLLGATSPTALGNYASRQGPRHPATRRRRHRWRPGWATRRAQQAPAGPAGRGDPKLSSARPGVNPARPRRPGTGGNRDDAAELGTEHPVTEQAVTGHAATECQHHKDLPVEHLAMRELCHRWRRSYLILQRTLDVPGRAVLVEQRQRYLDEMERRNPAAFGRWLRDGARAASDPSRYLTPPSATRT